jgi:hypothetical protein
VKLVLLVAVAAAALGVLRMRRQQGAPDLWHEATKPAPDTPSGT